MRFKAYKQAVILVLGFLGVSLLLFLIASKLNDIVYVFHHENTPI